LKFRKSITGWCNKTFKFAYSFKLCRHDTVLKTSYPMQELL
jgi:hypothetical protein